MITTRYWYSLKFYRLQMTIYEQHIFISTWRTLICFNKTKFKNFYSNWKFPLVNYEILVDIILEKLYVASSLTRPVTFRELFHFIFFFTEKFKETLTATFQAEFTLDLHVQWSPGVNRVTLKFCSLCITHIYIHNIIKINLKHLASGCVCVLVHARKYMIKYD